MAKFAIWKQRGGEQFKAEVAGMIVGPFGIDERNDESDDLHGRWVITHLASGFTWPGADYSAATEAADAAERLRATGFDWSVGAFGKRPPKKWLKGAMESCVAARVIAKGARLRRNWSANENAFSAPFIASPNSGTSARQITAGRTDLGPPETPGD